MKYCFKSAVQIIVLIISLFTVFSCASKPKAGKTDGIKTVPAVTEPETPVVNTDTPVQVTEVPTSASKVPPLEEKPVEIVVPKHASRTYFSRIDTGIMEDVENGSPASLRRAAASVRKLESAIGEPEKVLLALCASVMTIAWPGERIDWDVPEITEATPYLGAVDSAEKGVYDLSTGNVDFLTLVLPSLAVFTTANADDYFTAAEQSLISGLKMRPSSVLANYMLGMLYEKKAMNGKALDCFIKAESSAPECMQLAYAHADCLLRLGKISEAAAMGAALVAKYPSNINVLKLCANTSFAQKNYSSAEEYVARVLLQQPNDLEYVLFRARILVEKGDYIRAASLLDVYARQDSTSRDYLLLRARIQRDWSRNTTAAVATMEIAITKYPNDKDVLLFAAQLAASTGSEIAGRTAEDLSNAALAANPDNEDALRYAIEGMVQNKNWQKAYDASTRLRRKGFVSQEMSYLHIRICMELGKKDEAWNLASALYRDHPNDEDVLQMYITVLSGTGRTTQALSMINSLVNDASPKMKSFLYYRKSFIDAGREESLSDLRSSLIANPRNSDALLRMYQIYFERKDYRKAQYYLKQVVALNPNDAAIRKLNDELTRLIK